MAYPLELESMSPDNTLSFENLELAGDELGEGQLGQIAAAAAGVPTWIWAALGGAVVGAVGVWLFTQS